MAPISPCPWLASALALAVFAAPAGARPRAARSQPAPPPAAPHEHAPVPSPVDRAAVPTEGEPLTLEQLEKIALDRNPTLTQADALVEAAKGRKKQAGTGPNPILHYHAEEVGVAGTAGQHGPRVEQTILTAGKLRRARQVRAEEQEQAEALVQGQEIGVLLGVRELFYQALAAQQRVELRTRLLNIATETLTTTRELQNVGLARETEVLQAQVEADRARLALVQAEAQRGRVWRQLGAMAGDPVLTTPRPLLGSLETLPAAIDPGTEVRRLVDESPAIRLAEAGVTRAAAVLRRQRAERAPNVNLAAGPSYDFETRDVIGEVDVALPLPLVNRNQGNIRAAAAEVQRAQAEVQRVELSLQSRFGPAFELYEANLRTTQDYRERVIPTATRAYELSLEAYRRGAESFDQVLQAQRTLFQAQADYVDALQEVQTAVVRIRGFFQELGLDMVSPPEPANIPEVPANPFPY